MHRCGREWGLPSASGQTNNKTKLIRKCIFNTGESPALLESTWRQLRVPFPCPWCYQEPGWLQRPPTPLALHRGLSAWLIWLSDHFSPSSKKDSFGGTEGRNMTYVSTPDAIRCLRPSHVKAQDTSSSNLRRQNEGLANQSRSQKVGSHL